MVARLFHKQENKMKKDLWSMLPAILMISASIAFTACNNNVDNNDISGNNTEIKGDYTATTNVKTVTLKEYHDYSIGNVTIYKDFKYKYDLALYNGKMGLIPYERKAGSWGVYHYSDDSYRNIYIIDLGTMKNLFDVRVKIEETNRIELSDARPGHGYAACFLTEDGIQHLRLYISNYTLDSKDALESITVQYQLY